MHFVLYRALECDLISQGCEKKNLRLHWCAQPFEKNKIKSPQLRKSLCCSTTETLGSYRGLNQSEIVKGGPPPLIGRGPDIPVRVCTFEDARAAAVRQREIEVSSRDARSSFSESALFSERLTVPAGFCDR